MRGNYSGIHYHAYCVKKKKQLPVCSVKGDFTLFVILVLLQKHTELTFHTLLSFICI